MARKLKSDKVLFIATLLLVCASIVMVYSASARRRAASGSTSPICFLTKQALWTRPRPGGAGDRDAHRLPHLPERHVHLGRCSALVGLMLVGVLFSAPVNGTRRWFSVGGLGIQPSELAKIAVRALHGADARTPACTASTSCGTRCCRSPSSSARMVALILLAARLRHGGVAAADRRRDGVRRRAELPLSGRRGARRAAGALSSS